MQSMLQLVQIKQEGWVEAEAALCLRNARFSAACRDLSISANRTPLCTVWRHRLRSTAADSQSLGSILQAFMSRLQTSLNPGILVPVACCPYSRSLGIRPFFMRRTCPSHAAKASLTQYGKRAWDSSPGQDVAMWYTVLPDDAQNAFKTAHVEGI